MSDMLIVARKEFSDLLNSRLVLIVLAFYMFVLLQTFYHMYTNTITTPKGLILMEPGFDACYLGSLVAVVLGFSAMSEETSGKALNTLMVKPLYRDTIINGKLLGGVAFLSWIFWITVAIYTLAINLIAGSLISPYMALYVERLPFVFLLYLLITMLFFSLSMLMSILFKEQSFALFMGFLVWIVFIFLLHDISIMQNLVVSLNLALGGQYFSTYDPFSPISMIRSMLVVDNYENIGALISMEMPKMVKLAFYCFVSIALAYVAFLRKDVE
ncbi:MAG: ABC transporter permease subunit [Methanocella conradii]|nr:ABC transporter permease subunit [Methanocella conradii]